MLAHDRQLVLRGRLGQVCRQGLDGKLGLVLGGIQELGDRQELGGKLEPVCKQGRDEQVCGQWRGCILLSDHA